MEHHDTTIAGTRTAATLWRRTAIVAACAALSVAGLVARTSSAHAAASPITVSYTTVGEHTFVVPAGVTVLHVVAVGGRGFSPSAYGAQVTADLSVTPGQTLSTEVGGAGQGPTAGAVSQGFQQWVGGAGGANGGGAGGSAFGNVGDLIPTAGGGGGGATDIRTCATAATTCDSLASRLLVAGGGGGTGGGLAGGNGGTPDGEDGQNDGTADPGHGGTQTAGGAPGLVTQPGNTDFGVGGSPGTFGYGGDGASGFPAGGGGGGGGWYGGGGGATTSIFSTIAAGGGGGSSYGPDGTTYAVGQDRGGEALPASVTISYTPPGPLDHLTVAPAAPTIAAGGSRDFTAEGFDAQNVDLGDVTAATTFAITPDGSCTGATCTATTAGPHTIQATDGAATGTTTLTVTPGSAQSVTATAGTPQFATIGTAFANALAATVTDAYDNPVPGVDVTFTAPASGPSGAWNGETTAVVTTGTDGVAASPTFTANGTLGHYTVTATATGVSGSATYDLENTAASFPSTSQYASNEARWLYIDALFLHDSDLAQIQHTGAMFMAYLDGLIEGQHLTAPNLAVDPGSGPLVVTTSYTPDENATIQHAAAAYSTDVPSLQREGVELIAFLVVISQ
ncbi:MAG TPA: glycine-rich protein [Acidimicrobiia bacterium]|jgi:adhesin/invasin